MDSIEYYNQNSAEFFESTASVCMDDLYAEFEQHLPESAVVLDAGCGSGRDSKHFLSKGYNVHAFDASPEMVRLATNHIGIDVQQLRFEDLAARETYDGIWCCASLLHVPKFQMQGVLKRLWQAQKLNGICYVSFKSGEEERRVNGRFFNNYTPELLRAEIDRHSWFSIEKMWITKDNRLDWDETWVNAIIVKKR